MGAYPTNYASTDPEEHFAEAVSLLAFDDLSDDGAADLLDIIEGTPLNQPSAARVAALYDEGRVGKYWGSAGSGFLFTTGERILLLKRAPWVDQPGTWGIPGGAIPVDSDTGKPLSPLKGALREVREEVGMVPSYRMYDTYVFRDGSFSFTTFIATTEEFTPRLDDENTAYVWADREEVARLRLHPGVKKLLASVDPFTSEGVS